MAAKISEEDLALWQSLTKGAKPLTSTKRVQPQIKPHSTIEKRSKLKPHTPFVQTKPELIRYELAKPEQKLLAHGETDGLDARNARRLKRGQFSAQARLDLHGMTQVEAQRALSRFIDQCYANGKRHVIVVTGKGRSRESVGILKQKVPDWLNLPPNRERILAYDYAQPKDGGHGALYVKLKRKRGL